jgi:DNA-3-methyladenine glycosylase
MPAAIPPEDPLPLDRMLTAPILPQRFYSRPVVRVAKALIGKVVVHGATAGRIVEVEAYLGLDDLAAHASRGITERTRVIFGPPGRAYVYLIYGMYECLNLVAEPDGVAGCVLIRALEPLCGVREMFQRRKAAKKMEDLCSGPGKLTLALGITRNLNAVDVTEPGDFTVRDPDVAAAIDIATSPRIGITKCADWPLRFYERGNRFVSKTPKR